MFIMKLFSMRLDDAFEYVKTQREQTEPNDGFLEQLRKFQEANFAFAQEVEQEKHVASADRLEMLRVMPSNLSVDGQEEVKGSSPSNASREDQAFFGTIGNKADKEFVDIFSAGPS